MDIKEIIIRINSIFTPIDNYLVFQVDYSNQYFGKDVDGNIIFMMESSSPNIPSVCQETNSLQFDFNKKCIFQFEDKKEEKVMHVLTCKDEDEDKIVAFIRLTKTFSINDTGLEQFYLSRLFSSISALFDKKRKVSESEFQGLFAELYTILYLRTLGCDIAQYWQSQNKMKFDFSLNAKKRLEIKSTLKSERIHHFRHEQLLCNLYDIKIVSIMLRKNDYGISLSNIVEKIRELYSNNFALMLHIEKTLSQIENELIYGVKYDEPYLISNIRFYNAIDIPHFNEKSSDGVFNVEYDCQLDTSKYLTQDELIKWIREGEKFKTYNLSNH